MRAKVEGRHMIEARGLTKVFHKNGGIEVEVLRGLSFDIDRGEFVALMAPSGMGKTTLMNILGCLDRPTSGEYRLEGISVNGLSDDQLSRLRNEKIGFVFQAFHLLPRLTARENVELPLIYSSKGKEARKRALECLRAVGLGDRVDYRPYELSGGQQQRVAIARALVNDPLLLLADEPTGNLDSRSSGEILDLFQELHRQARTIVMVTHDAGVAAHAERIVHLLDGMVVSAEEVAEEGTKR